MIITEESLECSECDWVGSESEAKERDMMADEGTEYDCPTCDAICAHFPLDEIGNEVSAR